MKFHPLHCDRHYSSFGILQFTIYRVWMIYYSNHKYVHILGILIHLMKNDENHNEYKLWVISTDETKTHPTSTINFILKPNNKYDKPCLVDRWLAAYREHNQCIINKINTIWYNDDDNAWCQTRIRQTPIAVNSSNALIDSTS